MSEQNNKKQKEITKNLRQILKYIGDDPKREGLVKTPYRIIKSWNELFSGYDKDPEQVLATKFKEGKCDEMVILKNIEFSSMCEHHMLPFLGTVSIGYIPDKKVVGLSKLARIVEVFAKRLQIQEKMTSEIADAIEKYVGVKGVMVVIKAQHLCMKIRGVKKQNSQMVTSAIRGNFNIAEVRNEFLNLIREE
jgi:GTP cyclohydrolase I